MFSANTPTLTKGNSCFNASKKYNRRAFLGAPVTQNTSFQVKLLDSLKRTVFESSEQVLTRIVRLEMEELADQDPSFPAIAKNAKRAVLLVEEALADESLEFSGDGELIFKRFKEYGEILDHIAHAVTERSNEVLIDCIAHLQEFVDINNRGA